MQGEIQLHVTYLQVLSLPLLKDYRLSTEGIDTTLRKRLKYLEQT